MKKIKYYFISYIFKDMDFNSTHVMNCVFNEHPMKWLEKALGSNKILFYTEITKVQYDSWTIKREKKR